MNFDYLSQDSEEVSDYIVIKKGKSKFFFNFNFEEHRVPLRFLNVLYKTIYSLQIENDLIKRQISDTFNSQKVPISEVHLKMLAIMRPPVVLGFPTDQHPKPVGKILGFENGPGQIDKGNALSIYSEEDPQVSGAQQ